MSALKEHAPALGARAMTRGEWIALAALAALFLTTLVRTAWVSDDAFITFRTVDNAVNGYGLRWNVIERVQAYTHPLWMVLHIPIYALTREAFLTSIAVSMVTTFTALALLVFFVSPRPSTTFLALLVLVSSRAFVDYSTSGLENPMTHLLLAAFVALWLRAERERDVLWLSLVACALMLNRMDTVLLVGPALLALLVRFPTRRALAWMALGFVPFALWELFSLVYYGSLVPNTAYAKLGSGIPGGELFEQGRWYFANALARDPLTPLVIVAALVVPLLRRESAVLPFVVGVALYLLYVAKIGGDFMSGRFLTAPLWLSVLILARTLTLSRPESLAVAAVAVLLAAIPAGYPPLSGADYGDEVKGFKDANGVGDERRFYYAGSSLLLYDSDEPMPIHHFAESGRKARKTSRGKTRVHGAIGFRGYLAGPHVHIVDYFALADPLLARLPAKENPNWRIGHFAREVPPRYGKTAGKRKVEFEDEALAEYYTHVERVTRGPLWSWERFRSIWPLNTGGLDGLVAEYIARDAE